LTIDNGQLTIIYKIPNGFHLFFPQTPEEFVHKLSIVHC
jgi:hypothetical protein